MHRVFFILSQEFPNNLQLAADVLRVMFAISLVKVEGAKRVFQQIKQLIEFPVVILHLQMGRMCQSVKVRDCPFEIKIFISNYPDLGLQGRGDAP